MQNAVGSNATCNVFPPGSFKNARCFLTVNFSGPAEDVAGSWPPLSKHRQPTELFHMMNHNELQSSAQQ